MANGNEHTLQRDILGSAIIDIFNAHAGDTTVVTNTSSSVENVSSTILPSATRAISLSTKIASALNLSRRCTKVTLLAMFAKYRASSTAVLPPPMTCNFLIAIEKTIASCAGGNTFAREFLFTRKAKIFSRSASGNDKGIASVFAAITYQTNRFFT